MTVILFHLIVHVILGWFSINVWSLIIIIVFVNQHIFICVTLVAFIVFYLMMHYAQLIHSLATVRLDYCNSIVYGLPDNSLYRLQKIQNTAARILARLPRFSHISATLFDMHWLPIRYRIPFKICILTYQTSYCTILSMWFNCSICQHTVSKV